MKVTIRRIAEDEIEQVFQSDDLLDVQVEIGIQSQVQRFQIFHDPDTALLRITVGGRLVVFPCTVSSIFLTEVK